RIISVLPDKCPQSQIPSFPKNKKSKTEISSFPRRRESGISMPQEFIGKNQNPSAVIPTKVGI
ncbi:hypothetical protein, partial [Neisseria meningitidis]|uniref:hypothetical protein n=1 Tax=Neisseria meningitidis TaxID=487 RepID=UPI003FEE31CB